MRLTWLTVSAASSWGSISSALLASAVSSGTLTITVSSFIRNTFALKCFFFQPQQWSFPHPQSCGLSSVTLTEWPEDKNSLLPLNKCLSGVCCLLTFPNGDNLRRSSTPKKSLRSGRKNIWMLLNCQLCSQAGFIPRSPWLFDIAPTSVRAYSRINVMRKQDRRA